MPSFNGNIRDYPRFKVEFERHVFIKYKNNKDGAAYALKLCLEKEPAELVRNVDDNYEEMFKRLDEKYGNSSTFTDSIMNEIKNLNVVNTGDDKGFIKLVNIVESGYRDLERLSLQKEMNNSTSVSIIEDKLPSDIRRYWALEVSKNSNLTDKFTTLLNFLLEHKKAIEYDSDNIRTASNNNTSNITSTVNHTLGNLSHNSMVFEPRNTPIQYNDMNNYMNFSHNSGFNNNEQQQQCMVYGDANYFQRNAPLPPQANPPPPPPPPPPQQQQNRQRMCCIHRTNTHTTEECNNFIGMSAAQKVEVVRNHRLCFVCLREGHRSFQCRNRVPCGIDNCQKTHHKSLHQGSVEGLGFHTRGHPGSSGCLLQVMKIQASSTSNDPLIVFFDGGATISLIKFDTAAKLGLHGTDVMMTVTRS